MSETTVNILIAKVMTDKYCHAEKRDLNACTEFYVPKHIDSSFVDASLQRRGMRKCDDYQTAYSRCIQDDKKQQQIIRHITKMKEVKEERNALMRCQQQYGGRAGNNCDAQFYAMAEAGLVHMIQRMQGQQQQRQQQADVAAQPQ